MPSLQWLHALECMQLGYAEPLLHSATMTPFATTSKGSLT